MVALGVVPHINGIVFGVDTGWRDRGSEACGCVAICAATTMVTRKAGSQRGLRRRPSVVFCVCPCSDLCGSDGARALTLQSFLLCLLVAKSESPAGGAVVDDDDAVMDALWASCGLVAMVPRGRWFDVRRSTTQDLPFLLSKLVLKIGAALSSTCGATVWHRPTWALGGCRSGGFVCGHLR